MRRNVVISVALHAAILLSIVVMFPLGAALNESPKDIPLDIMSAAEFTKLKAGTANAKADKPLTAKSEKPRPKAVTEKKPVEQPAPAPKEKPPEPKKSEPQPETAKAAPKRKKAPKPKQAEAKPDKPVKTAKAEKPKSKPKSKPKREKQDLNTDRISALLNKIPDAAQAPAPPQIVPEAPQEPVRGQSTGTELSMSVNEIDALRACIAQCWNPPPGGLGAESIVVKIRLMLNEDGTLVGYPTVANRNNSPFFRAAADSAVRAVFQCQPYTLPSEKYSSWRDMILNFDPSQMYRSG